VASAPETNLSPQAEIPSQTSAAPLEESQAATLSVDPQSDSPSARWHAGTQAPVSITTSSGLHSIQWQQDGLTITTSSPLGFGDTLDSKDSADSQQGLQGTSSLPGLTALQESARHDRSLTVQSVQWYPGHIARAERQLKEHLKMVDVVMEVRDARIPVSTHHPQVASWVGTKPRVLVINRQDQVSDADRRAWANYYRESGQRVFWTHGKKGDGVQGLKKVLMSVSESINEKRVKRGLQPRPVRACVIGFPNIGKSALINRLLGRRAVASAPKPGVTRQLQWVRLSGQLDLLDAPGVIPASFNDQIAAQRLAVCNDIGEAAYVNSLVAAAFLVRCKLLPNGPAFMQALRDRYGVDPEVGSAEDFVVRVADKMFFGHLETSGARILKDYRTGALGSFALELPTDIDDKRRREVDDAAKRAQEEEERDARYQETGFRDGGR